MSTGIHDDIMMVENANTTLPDPSLFNSNSSWECFKSFSFNLGDMDMYPSFLDELRTSITFGTPIAAESSKSTSSIKKTPVRKAIQSKHQTTKRTTRPRRVIPENKEYIPEGEEPKYSDVVSGRGGRSNHHMGNRRYFGRVLDLRKQYRECAYDEEKTVVAQSIVDFIQNGSGRFLQRECKTKRWFVLPDKVALDKAKQALRDKYIPVWAQGPEGPAQSGESQHHQHEEDIRTQPQQAPTVEVEANSAVSSATGQTPSLLSETALSCGYSFDGLLQNPIFSIGRSAEGLSNIGDGLLKKGKGTVGGTNWNAIYQEEFGDTFKFELV